MSNIQEIHSALEAFSEFKHLWATDRTKDMEQFMEQEPSLQDFNLEIIKYRNLEDTVNDITVSVPAGPIALMTGGQ